MIGKITHRAMDEDQPVLNARRIAERWVILAGYRVGRSSNEDCGQSQKAVTAPLRHAPQAEELRGLPFTLTDFTFLWTPLTGNFYPHATFLLAAWFAKFLQL